jgi:pimeloyl-ACP methyl ester carboxylesterase
MKLALALCLTFLPACTRITVPGDWHLHASPSVFSGSALPTIEVMPPKDNRGRAERFTVTTCFYDANFNPVTSAQRLGRYGAIVEITSESRAFRRYVTLFRAPGRLDWDGARMDLTARFPPELGISAAAADRKRSAISDFFKYALEALAQRGPNGEDTDVAAMLAGLYESGASPTTQPFVAREGFRARDQRWWATLKRRTRQPTLPYLISLPRRSTALSPMILFLHGSGECGDGGPELARVQATGLPRRLNTREGLPADFPFIVLMPQCPPNQYWSPYDLIALLDEVQTKYPIDPDRIYLTGLSLGGYGTWDTAIAFPDRFAAIAPVCGAGDPADVARIIHLPTWVFHGSADPTVPIAEADRMVRALHLAAGREVNFTIYHGVGHDAWTKAYATPELYEWFLQHRR